MSHEKQKQKKFSFINENPIMCTFLKHTINILKYSYHRICLHFINKKITI